MVEFAIILPVVLIILLGIIDLGRVFYSYEALANAAREGARNCALDVDCDVLSARAKVESELAGRVAISTTAISYPGTGFRIGGSPVRVTVTSDFNFVTPFLDDIISGVVNGLADEPVTLAVSAEMVVWQ